MRIVNLSLGGACIETSESVLAGSPPVAPGMWVTVDIVAPTLWDPLSLRSRVIWSSEGRGSPTQTGLEFEHRDPALAYTLFELLRAHDYEV